MLIHFDPRPGRNVCYFVLNADSMNMHNMYSKCLDIIDVFI